MSRTLTTIALLTLSACLPTDEAIHQPLLSEVSDEADLAVDLVDRSAVLADAEEDVAGELLDLGSAGTGFAMAINSEELQAAAATPVTSEADGPPPPSTFQNVAHATAALVWADLAVVAVVGPPAAAINIASQGTLTQIEPWLWSATNTVVGPEGQSASVRFNVAWVGLGWLAEMRLTTSDGAYNNTLWFNGFIAANGGLGWWDVYSNGTVAGVVEWMADGQGAAEFGIAALHGEIAGDTLSYWLAGGEGLVVYTDASTGFASYVVVAADHSGEVNLPDYNGAAPACWGPDLADVVCDE